jgi:hypothetical protein
MKNSRIFIIIAAVVILLLIPLVAMQFTDQVEWKVFDFRLMGSLLSGVGLAIEVIMRKTRNVRSRIILCGAALFVFLLIWAELAVGIFGSPIAGS